MSDAENIATGRIEIHLGALVRNYKRLRAFAATAECAATVKANAYGHGVEHVIPALTTAGCRTYFVATPQEGAEARILAPDAKIYVLNGLMPGTADFLLEHQLKPVLGDLTEYTEWFDATDRPAALHVDTGLNRSGLSPGELDTLQNGETTHRNANIDLIMSHLACGDEPNHPLNVEQNTAFNQARALFPAAQASLANSAGMFGGPQHHFDLMRPGISLYGGRAVTDRKNPMEPVARVFARVLKIRDNWDVNTVGYGATKNLATTTRIATIAIGYADGLSRHLSTGDKDTPALVWCTGKHVPIIGRISMDLTTIDITSLPDTAIKRGDMVEIFGENNNVDILADRAGTMGYEFLTQLSRRFPKHVIPINDEVRQKA